MLTNRRTVRIEWGDCDPAGIVYFPRYFAIFDGLELVEPRAPRGFLDLEAVISREELDAIASSYKRTAGFDPETLNTRPSLGVGRPATHRSRTSSTR